jgi:Tripartite tricarboxylate transporter family receptor
VFMTERGGPMTPKAFHALFGHRRDRAVNRRALHPSFPAKTILEFIAYSKSNPGKVNMGSGTTGAEHRAQQNSPCCASPSDA